MRGFGYWITDKKKEEPMPSGYGDTIVLPKTLFPMRGQLPLLEQRLLLRWSKMGLWDLIREGSRGREKFILHDGPPYANGHLHMGHVINKVLKDLINKSRQMMGYDANYVPGWDCHGLPIEWLVEEKFRSEGYERVDIDVIDFRRACRLSAEHWIGVQSDGFQRLGVFGDWKNPYKTMTYEAEALTAREIGRFLISGSLYRGVKPVQWSVPEQTMLAEAETEYEEHVSRTVFVGYRIVEGKYEGDDVVIWTTTPWTLPSSQAVAYGEDMEYERIRIVSLGEGGLEGGEGRVVWFASCLRERLVEVLKITSYEVCEKVKGSAFEGSVANHPLSGRGYDCRIPLLSGDYVTGEQGTGFVHTAPDHGVDDFYLGKKHGLEPLELVGLDGKFRATVPLFGGSAVWTKEGKEGDANKRIMEELEGAGVLYGCGKLRHQYPHSWRSRAPLMTLVTAQWFVSMEHDGLRERALQALSLTDFYPQEGKRRLETMIGERPDWCLSRQRSWGVPLPLFVHKETGEVLRDEGVMERVVSLFREEGADAWFLHDKSIFLGEGYRGEDYDQVMDVVDVWFDSGTTHRFVLDEREDLKFPADMYLEGTDQHRGWFHSSLLVSCGTRGEAPYKSILTHGFVVDGKGRKMSKSVGNTLDPYDVMGKMGAEILRLWVVECRYYHDMKADIKIMQRTVDVYRRFRNSLRWLLGNLAHEGTVVEVREEDLSVLDRYMLHRVSEINEEVWESCETHEYHRLYRTLHSFCTLELSALYFDVSKDTLYCDGRDEVRCGATMKVLRVVFDHLVRWLAPVLSFTAEEAYLCDKGYEVEGEERVSVHMEGFLPREGGWKDEELSRDMAKTLRIRQVVLGALEVSRVQGLLGSSLEAHADVYVSDGMRECGVIGEMERLCLTSSLDIHGLEEAPLDGFMLEGEKEVVVSIVLAEGKKCERCWMVLPEVGSFSRVDVCKRCDDVLEGRE